MFDGPCNEVAVDAPACTKFDPKAKVTTATNAPDDLPVCVAHSPLSSAPYGQRSTCEVSGDALIEVDDEDELRGSRGTVSFVGQPCAGDGCSVGVEFGL